MNRRCRLGAQINETIGAALLGCLIASLLVSAVGIASLLSIQQFGPQLGESLTFGSYGGTAPTWRINAVRISDHRSCVLQPNIMAAGQGSMEVEERFAEGRVFRVHWAGGPTSNRGGDCGSVADLDVGRSAIQALINAEAANKGSSIGF